MANSEEVSWGQLIKTAISVLEQEVPKVQISTIKMNEIGVVPREFFPFRDNTFLMSTEKLSESGLYTPKINLIDGISRAYHWYQKQHRLPNYDKMPKVDYVIDSTKVNKI